MAGFIGFVSILVFFAMLIGLLNPRWVKVETRKKVLIYYGIGSFVLFGIGVSLSVKETPISPVVINNPVTANKEVAVKKSVSKEIIVTSQIVKRVNGKCRYFFDVRNKDKTDFTGSVTVSLFSDIHVWDETFDTTNPIKPNLGTSIFTDANTCPPILHGSAGVTNFKYEVKDNGQVVKTGAGKISDKFEDSGI